MPHRDFTDLYTGGLTGLHALAFEFLGVRLLTLRVVLFVAVVLWVPVLYAATRRFAAPMLAGAATLLAVVWSVPAYPASMPSWYNLFFATAGLLATLRYEETQRYRWLFIAGVCGGLSVLVKIAGVYYLGAIALALVYRGFEPHPPRGTTAGDPGPGSGTRGTSRPAVAWLGIATACGIAAVLLRLVLGTRTSPGTYLQIVVPGVTVGIVLAAAGWDSRGMAWPRLGKSVGALALGAMAVVLPFVALYAWHHALGDLVRGVFLLPTRRLRFAAQAPNGAALAWSLPFLSLAAISLRVRRPRVAALIAGLIGALGALLVAVGRREPGPGGIGGEGPVYRAVVDSVASIVPILAGAFAMVLLTRRPRAFDPVRRQQAFAAVAVMAFGALIQFPFSNDLYFHYVAPLIVLALLAVYSISGRSVEPRIGAAMLAVYLVFGVVRVRVNASAPLALERGGLRVPPQDSAEAIAFVQTLRAHARNGYTYATPDCPEAYFLTGLRNPTRTMYERFDEAPLPTDSILALLDAHRVTAVAVSHWRISSSLPAQRLLAALRERYPDSAVVWHFTVRWKRENGPP